VMVVVALPILGLRLGTSDSGTDPSGWTTHQAYVALSDGFGPGFNGPLQMAGSVRSPSDAQAFTRLLSTTAKAPDVASVTKPVTSPNGEAIVATVYPTTSPQATQTVDLVGNLRDRLIPQAEHGTGLVVHVGGETATNIDFARVLGEKLPLFITVVVLLALILLAAVFRSLLVPVIASVLTLLSVGAALGAVNAVFNWGWGASVLGLNGSGPIDAFLPILLFAVLFGLSMDYEVFTVSRMQEEWRRLHHRGLERDVAVEETQRNHQAVTLGQARSSRIIFAAAGIMILVFGSFLVGGHRLLQEFGFGLAFSVLIDAVVIRSLLLPAVMHIVGPANWAMPNWLSRVLPRLDIEGPDANRGDLEQRLDSLGAPRRPVETTAP
jgi:putative drug exporter of the RND superfamily